MPRGAYQVGADVLLLSRTLGLPSRSATELERWAPSDSGRVEEVFARRLLLALVLGSACGSEEAPRSEASAGGAGGTASLGGAAGDVAGSAGSGEIGGAAGSGGFAGEGGASGASAGPVGPAGAGGGGELACSSSTRAGCRRGLYLSAYSSQIGQVMLTGDQSAYAEILGDEQKEASLLQFIELHGFDSIALYNLNVILADEDLSTALQSFMARARDAGVERIEAIGAEGSGPWDAIHEFHEERAPFDGLVTEIEFWAGSVSFDDFIDTLEYVRSLTFRDTESGAAPTLTAYVGWPTAEQVEAMLPLLDRLYVHAYVKNGELAHGYVAERFQAVHAANQKLGTNVEVRPIFSAEGEAWAAGDEHFMGEWLAEHGLAAAESALLGDFEASSLAGELELDGYQYYEYFFLQQYLP